MRSYTRLVIVAILVSLVSSGFGQDPNKPTGRAASPNDVNAVSALSFPYVAQIIGDDVYVRSGAGTNYYNCSKLKKGDRVQVVSTMFSWSRIVPPPGSFSWISAQFVAIDPNSPGVGIVTGDNVRVYAGSDEVRPMHSTSLQLKLNRGDKVKLLGEEKENYYKIASPSGAYLWVSSEYIKPLAPAGGVVAVTEVGEASTERRKVEPNDTIVGAPKISIEAEKLKEYYELEKRLKAERAKPIEQQSYSDIKKALVEIAGNKEAGKASRFAEFTIRQVERFELAVVVAKEVKLQDTQLLQTRERIDKMRATKLANLEELGRFTVIGQFKTSSIFGAEPHLRHYRITDESDNAICYAFGVGQAATMDFSKFIGHKVGLVGTLEAHPQTAKALVKFTEIVELK
jgi:hypothetical protein